MALAFAPADPDRRLFIAEKTGRVRIVSPQGVVTAAPFLDLSSRVSSGREQGLLGIALHPKYRENRRLFVNFTDRDGHTRVTEFKADAADPGKADLASEREWLFQSQPFSNHNGGNLQFGPDGRLYIGLGDGGSGNDPLGNAQNDATRLGKMLALDVDDPEGVPDAVAKGLRNPWRYSFDRLTGDLYLGDVGQNAFEEVDVVPAGTLQGRNFGWAIVEGDGHCVGGGTCNQAGFARPVLEYPTGSEGCSVIGGYVYRGKAIPELSGTYFYADYCSAFVRSFKWTGSAAEDRRDWTQILDPDRKLAMLVSFGEDVDGEQYLLSQNGAIFKFVRRM
jgi:glucose/arabinose dehydrogenase